MFQKIPGLELQVRRRGKARMAKEGAYQIMQVCKAIVKEAVDLSSWESKIIEEIRESQSDDALPDLRYPPMKEESNDLKLDEHVMFDNGMLTIGCVGFPNVGKSSLMNALMGRKVVSVSKTPGHTKHFQTIFLTNNVRLCDCPGLVFPSSVPRNIQVLIGSYPIAQLREPFASVRYLAERIDLIKTLNIKVDGLWSAAEICDAWALKRGFLTAKAGRPDTNRAANSILRMALAGQIRLSFLPPNFVSNEGTSQQDCRSYEIKNQYIFRLVKFLQNIGRTMMESPALKQLKPLAFPMIWSKYRQSTILKRIMKVLHNFDQRKLVFFSHHIVYIYTQNPRMTILTIMSYPMIMCQPLRMHSQLYRIPMMIKHFCTFG